MEISMERDEGRRAYGLFVYRRGYRRVSFIEVEVRAGARTLYVSIPTKHRGEGNDEPSDSDIYDAENSTNDCQRV